MADSLRTKIVYECINIQKYLLNWNFGKHISFTTEVNHVDFNRSNNMVDNLEWTTAQQNALHTLKAGRIFGLKIDLEKANMIRQKYQTGHYTQTSLAREFGIGQDEISRIVNDKIWEGK